MRWQRLLLTLYFFRLCRKRPARARQLLLGGVRHWMGNDRRSIRTSRRATTRGGSASAWCRTATCFRAVTSGRAAIVTGEIERFTPTGVRLAGGEEIAADLIVTATGLTLQAFGGASISVDGRPVDWPAASPTRARCSATCPTWSRCSATPTRPGR
jgi:cation diffusion facilitator CzcD-associated flavoprotein CzcO